jgi:hypothetical protein
VPCRHRLVGGGHGRLPVGVVGQRVGDECKKSAAEVRWQLPFRPRQVAEQAGRPSPPQGMMPRILSLPSLRGSTASWAADVTSRLPPAARVWVTRCAWRAFASKRTPGPATRSVPTAWTVQLRSAARERPTTTGGVAAGDAVWCTVAAPAASSAQGTRAVRIALRRCLASDLGPPCNSHRLCGCRRVVLPTSMLAHHKLIPPPWVSGPEFGRHTGGADNGEYPARGPKDDAYRA